MGWQLVVGLNAVIVTAYLVISSTIVLGLKTSAQLRSNVLALGTAAIFATCALHHGHHALHVLALGEDATTAAAIQGAYGTWHSIVIDVLGAGIAVLYLSLRRHYGTLLNTPDMFENQVRLATEKRLHELAFSDQLTGCGNRAAYDEYLDSLTGTQQPVTIAFLDLDGFKQINDTTGHEAGDRVLRQIGRRLAEVMTPSEKVFRVGGDEFVVVQIASCPEAEAELEQRCREAVSTPIDLREGTLRPQASIGVAHGLASAGLAQLVREADAHMYDAKTVSRASRQVPGPRPPVFEHLSPVVTENLLGAGQAERRQS